MEASTYGLAYSRTSPRPASYPARGFSCQCSAGVSMIGDYPTQGWKFWAALAFIVVLGLIGVALVVAMTGHTIE